MPSSVIRSWRYDPVEKNLDLVFMSGRRYRYHEVPLEIFDGLRRSFSKGEYFNARIRDQHRHTRLD